MRTPVTRGENGVYVRSVDVGKSIGYDKFNDFAATSRLIVITDRAGNLLTAFPGGF